MKKRQVSIRKSMAGSITVEAAFVMPIVILTVFVLIYLSFYLHDICRIQGIVDLSVHKAGLLVKHEADIATGKVPYEAIKDSGLIHMLSRNMDKETKELENLLEQELSKGIFLVRIRSIETDVDRFKIEVSIKTDMTISLPLVSNLFDLLPDKVISCEYPVHDPAETIRCMEVILDTGKGIKGTSK